MIRPTKFSKTLTLPIPQHCLQQLAEVNAMQSYQNQVYDNSCKTSGKLEDKVNEIHTLKKSFDELEERYRATKFGDGMLYNTDIQYLKNKIAAILSENAIIFEKLKSIQTCASSTFAGQKIYKFNIYNLPPVRSLLMGHQFLLEKNISALLAANQSLHLYLTQVNALDKKLNRNFTELSSFVSKLEYEAETIHELSRDFTSLMNRKPNLQKESPEKSASSNTNQFTFFAVQPEDCLAHSVIMRDLTLTGNL